MEAFAAMALPHILQAAYTALTAAWAQYESVKEQKAQCKALLDRCTDLLLAVARQSNLRPNDPMMAHVHSLIKCVCLKTRRFELNVCTGLVLP